MKLRDEAQAEFLARFTENLRLVAEELVQYAAYIEAGNDPGEWPGYSTACLEAQAVVYEYTKEQK